MTLNPFLCIDLSISDSLRSVRKSVLIYETIISGAERKRALEVRFMDEMRNTKQKDKINKGET